MKVVTAAEMRAMEQGGTAGLSFAAMMENAGRAVAEEIERRWAVAGQSVLVLVGPGNNGGDGLVTARHLHDAGAIVNIYLLRPRPADDPNWRLCQERGLPTTLAEDDTAFATLRRHLANAAIIVDALLGTGAARPIEGTLQKLLEVVKSILPLSLSPRLPLSPAPIVVAVDLPTGLNGDSGAADPAILPADLTVTFACPKRGHFLFPGAKYVGELVIADIGIPPALAADVPLALTTPAEARGLLPPRPLDAHKGTFGKALVVAGSENYTGAAYLAAAAASRVGTGLVTLACARSLHPIWASKLVEAIFLPLPEAAPGHLGPEALETLLATLPTYDALLLGPGLGQHPGTVELVVQIVKRFRSSTPAATKKSAIRNPGRARPPASGQSAIPLVLDADALNALARTPGWAAGLPPGRVILTPHPGEMGRLLGRSIAAVETQRIETAQEAARAWQQVVILKGAYSLIAGPDGRVAINPFANPALATAGTGDVLAGALVGLLAQGLAPFDAARLGAYLHGLAGELASEEIGEAGVVAGDLLPRLPAAMRRLRLTSSADGLRRSG
jgi:NAD(P)H-hydrate epimerase